MFKSVEDFQIQPSDLTSEIWLVLKIIRPVSNDTLRQSWRTYFQICKKFHVSKKNRNRIKRGFHRLTSHQVTATDEARNLQSAEPANWTKLTNMSLSKFNSVLRICIRNYGFTAIRRDYGPEAVEKLRGSLTIEQTLARRGAKRLKQLICSGEEDSYVNALGAMTG